jgi:hypothetical protein
MEALLSRESPAAAVDAPTVSINDVTHRYGATVIAHACFLTAILARLFGNLTGESGADSSFG